MNDLISRQAVLDAMCDNCDTVQAVCPHYPCKRYMAIETLPPASPWIPVTERLPEDVELGVKYPTVIFCTEDATYTGYYEYHIGGLWLDEDGDNIIHGVIAWMPLPEPWKGEDDAEVH